MLSWTSGPAVLASLLVLLSSTLICAQEDYGDDDFNDGSCSDKKLKCDEEALCTQNVDHSRFRCYCPDGFYGDGYLSTYKENATGCTLLGDPVECRYDKDCHPYAACVPLKDTGLYICDCNYGFTGDGSIDDGCNDINECLDNHCAENAVCTNTPPGSFTCECDSEQNYEGDGYENCERVCYNAQDCGENAHCKDWKCQCDDGFYGDGIICTDFDECATDNHTCPNRSTCDNNPGGYECLCFNGFEYKQEDNLCVPYYKTCDEMYQTTGGMPNGQYTLDFDGEGPLPAVEVWCTVKQGFAITEVSPIIPFPLPVPSQGQEVPVPYPVPVFPLLENSDFCSQEVWMKCTAGYDGGRVQWEGADGNRYTGWGGNGKSQNCACGDVGQCPDGCRCGNGQTGEDWGLIIKKSALPLSKVILPPSSGGGDPGNYFVGKLRCGPHSFDIPRDCQEAKFQYAITQNTPLFIDLDGPGPVQPVLVYCNQEAYSHVGIIEITPDQLDIKKTTSEGQPLDYTLPGPDVTAVIDGSVFCSQRVEYRCQTETMTASGVRVTSRSGEMTYFPGGSNDKPGSCGCGITNSCDSPDVLCNCDMDDGKSRSDFGLIVDKAQLPVLNVRSTSGDNVFSIGPLQCSQKQFGIEPNCEKYRQAEITEDYSYLIDPDGPKGLLSPFTVECEMDENKGVTAINNEGGDNLDLVEGKVFNINYLESTPEQLDGLKYRSTMCEQQLTFTNCGAEGVNIGGLTYNGGRSLSEQLVNSCIGDVCPCDVPLTVSMLTHLPIVKIKGSGIRMTVGAFKCKEIYPDCESYHAFVRTKGVEGEKLIIAKTLTIDPDGAEEGEAFVVRCVKKKQTVIDPPTPSTTPVLKLIPGKPNPGEVCYKMNYTDATGAGIGAPQMDALMDSAKKCAQTFKLVCSNAMGTGMVKYRNCAGKEFTSFVGNEVEATCACGATGMCQGGPDQGCHCDSGEVRTTDVNWIITNYRLPICEVCVELDDITGSGAGVPDFRLIKFEVSELRCGKKQGRKPSCHRYRREKKFRKLTEETEDSIWMDTKTKPVIVGCRLTPDPPVATMIIRPEDPVYIPGEDFEDGDITIIYRGFPIIRFRDVTQKSNYCTQDLFFFCAEGIPDLTGDYGLWSGDDRLASSDYELRDLSEERAKSVCSDDRFSEQCETCGRSPRLLVVTNKDRLPLSKVVVPPTSSTHVAVNDVTCAYVEKDCNAILKSNRVASDVMKGAYYLIDPDQAGPLLPFKVRCDFQGSDSGITVVNSDVDWAIGKVGGSGGDKGADFSFTHTYPSATPEQINSLAQESEFCWQGVKYKCTEAPLAGSNLVGYNNQSLSSFGTADDSDVTGCACGVLGTCETAEVTCNCDNQGSMVDQGFLTDKDVLPVTGFKATYEPNGQGSLSVTDVRCGPAPTDIPRDCAQAHDWQSRYGISFRKSGEFLISPAPDKVRPFLVYCDYSIDPENPVTVIKPDPTEDVPVGEENPEIPYQGPSDEQIMAVVEVSAYCYQPVKVDCLSASFIAAGVQYVTVLGRKRKFWSTGGGVGTTCTCGSENVCGGTLSRSQQKLTNCNCDIGDDERRSDAAILDVKKAGPVRSLLTAGIFDPDNGQLNFTVGDVFCAQKPIEFNECETGFHDCAELATCIDEAQGYRCECPPGWSGKSARTSNPDVPMANGRQCIDDDECTLSNQCRRYNSDCENTLGSYRCVCKEGYRQVDDFTCVDINECAENTHNCDENARCINTDGSYRCRCHMGYRGSGQVGNCRAVAQCACFGDPHCESYDGRWSHYQGLCSYILAGSGSNCDNDTNINDTAGSPTPGTFLVTSRNWDHNYVGSGEYAWIKEVVVRVYGQTIELGQGNTITVNGEPRASYSMMSEDGASELLSVFMVGKDVEVFTDFGLEVVWDGSNDLTLYTPTSFRGKLCGLCGNFNQNPDDDWEVGPACPELRGQTTSRQPLFGNSWTYDLDTCPVNCDPLEPETTCNAPMALVWEECSKLFTIAAFTECIKQMPEKDLVGFNDSCVYDLCHSDSPGTSLCDVGIAFAKYCTDLLAQVIEWKTQEMCSDDFCDFVECSEPNAHCVDGECLCLMGFTADCHQCVDIDECVIGEHNCTHLGQRCNNTDGSFECGCREGFTESGPYCKNINECEDPEVECPGHAECHDFPGGYECVCCLGYVMEGDKCIRDTSQDAVYGAPGRECCACTGSPCRDPQPVCGTDGESYANYKAMVVIACKEKRDVEVDYPGTCAESCEPSPCDKPFQTCSVQNGTATCNCPSCGGGGSSQRSGPVCASNNKVYPSECAFQVAMCETGNSETIIEISLEPCKGEGSALVGPWSEWSECDNQCGKGTTRRTREKLGNTNYPLEEEMACYTLCKDGLCQSDTCLNPGQVCQVAETGEPVAQCVCPDCRGQPDSPVCGLVGNMVRTYDNPCLLQQKACELIKNFTVLEERACEDKPRDCAAVRNFAVLNDTDGCISLGGQDVGQCYGGCGMVPSLCCLPVQNDLPDMVTLTYRCPDSSYRRKKHERITACECVELPEK